MRTGPSAVARWGAGGVLLLLAACGPNSTAPPDPSGPRPAEAGFVPPPRVVSAARGADGSVILGGTSAPLAKVRLASPGGDIFNTQADGKGRWRIVVSPRMDATLFGLSTTAEGRSVQAEGYVAILPAPGRPAALLKAGSGTAAFGSDPDALSIRAVDVDAAGAAVVAGQSPANTPLSAELDGAPAGRGVAAETGSYQLALSGVLASGARHFVVRGGGQEAVADLTVAPPRAPARGPWQGERLGQAWRIDWVTPGMGLQASFVLDEGAGR